MRSPPAAPGAREQGDEACRLGRAFGLAKLRLRSWAASRTSCGATYIRRCDASWHSRACPATGVMARGLGGRSGTSAGAVCASPGSSYMAKCSESRSSAGRGVSATTAARPRQTLSDADSRDMAARSLHHHHQPVHSLAAWPVACTTSYVVFAFVQHTDHSACCRGLDARFNPRARRPSQQLPRRCTPYCSTGLRAHTRRCRCSRSCCNCQHPSRYLHRVQRKGVVTFYSTRGASGGAASEPKAHSMSSGGGPAAAQTHTHSKSLGMGIATGLMQNRREDGVRAKGPKGPQDRAPPRNLAARHNHKRQDLHRRSEAALLWSIATAGASPGHQREAATVGREKAVVAPTPDLRPSSLLRELTRLRTSLTPGGEGGAMKLEAALVLQVFVCSDAHSYMKSAAGRCLQLGPCLVLISCGPDGASASRCMHAGGGFMMKQAGSLSAVKNPWLRLACRDVRAVRT